MCILKTIKILMKEIKEDKNKWRNLSISGLED